MKTKYEITFTNIFLFLFNEKKDIEQFLIGKNLYIFLKYQDNIKLIEKLSKQSFPIHYIFYYSDIYLYDLYLDSLNDKINIIVYFK